MPQLAACYFCGDAVGASLDEHALPADASSDEQVTVTLCSGCAAKLDRLLERLPDAPGVVASGTGEQTRLGDVGESPATDPAGSGSTAGAPSSAGRQPADDASGAGTVSLEEDPEPIFAGDEGTLLGSDEEDSSSAADGAEPAADGAVGGPTASEPAATADDEPQSQSTSGAPEVTFDAATEESGDGASDATTDATGDEAVEPDASGADDESVEGPAAATDEADPPVASDVGPESADDATDAGADDASADPGGSSATADDAAPDDDSGGETAAGDATGRVSARTYNRVVRLLQNREFPVDRTEFEALASSAYDFEPDQVAAALDVAVEKDLLVERDGHLHRPS